MFITIDDQKSRLAMRFSRPGAGRGSGEVRVGFHSLSPALSGVLLLLLLLGGALQVEAATTSSTSSSTTNPFPLKTDKSSYTGNATIIVSGTLAGTNVTGASDVAVYVYNPRNVQMTVQNVGVQNNESFSEPIQAGGPSWNVSGTYQVAVETDIPDFTGVPPTSYTTFQYTYVPPSTTTTSSTSLVSVSTSNPGSGITLLSILPVLVVLVLAIGVVGYVLSSRGRGRPARPGGGSAPQPPMTRATRER